MSWLKDERLRLRYTQGEMASMLGITRTTYIKYEASPDELTLAQVKQLQAIGIEVNTDLKAVACPACDGTGILYKA